MHTENEVTAKTSKQLIADGIAVLAAQLEAGNSAALSAHLATMARFHNYSLGNVMAIARQIPDASRVAGFHAWKSLGRSVKKGEKAIRILAPMVLGRNTKKGEPRDETKAGALVGFRTVCVFDISQTEGAELPPFTRADGETFDNIDKLLAFAASQGIAVTFADQLDGGALGMSYGGRIQILAMQTDAETFTTLVHELAHELLHKGEARTGSTKTTRELEAEAVAFIVGSAIGLDMATSSADYIKLYNGDSETLAASLEAISRAATAILKAVTAATSSEVAA